MVSLKLTLETGVLCQAAKAGKAKQRVRKVKTTRKAYLLGMFIHHTSFLKKFFKVIITKELLVSKVKYKIKNGWEA